MRTPHQLPAVDSIGDHASEKREHEPRDPRRNRDRAMRKALRVTADANHGSAIVVTPSPRFAITLDVQSLQ